VDVRALPAPDRLRPELASEYAAPRNPAEQTLAGIWAEVLGVDRVGIHDNFFQLGGDSILSIQAVARARQAGLKITPRQVFQCQTIARLTDEAGSAAAVSGEQGPVTGAVPLTPVQCWFFEQELPDPHHFNQSLLLELRLKPDAALLEKALQALVIHHDALRLRFARTESGWLQTNAAPDELPALGQTDLSQVPEAERERAMEVRAAELHRSLDLGKGPLVRFELFQSGPDKPARLLLVAHHLVVDGVSWRILLEDLEAAYGQLSAGRAIQLPPKTTSFKHWAGQLVEHAQSPALREELDYWLAQIAGPAASLPADSAATGGNTVESARGVRVSLAPEETRALLQEVPAAYQTRINDVLLAALAQAMARWTGSGSFLVDVEGHGREEVVEADLSRTVGWFTSIFPLRLCLGDSVEPGAALKAIKEQLRQVPNNGIGYGLLRYLSEDPEIGGNAPTPALAPGTAQAPCWGLRAQPELSFNYLGQFDQAGAPSFAPAKGGQLQLGLAQSPRGCRDHVLGIVASIVQGCLQVEWSYSANIHRRETIENLAGAYIQALRALIAHCQSPEAGGYTPSDFPEAGLNQQELDALLGEL